MIALRLTLFLFLNAVFVMGCSVISPEVRREAEPEIPFKNLVEAPESYVGRTVILGGYVIEMRHENGERLITVLQTPLGFRQQPKPKNLSEGRFIVSYGGDPGWEVRPEDHKITVAGKVLGFAAEKYDDCPRPCPKITGVEMYLWPKYREYPYGPGMVGYEHEFSEPWSGDPNVSRYPRDDEAFY